MLNNLLKLLLQNRHYFWSLFYILISIFIFLSLYSYNSQDASMNRTSAVLTTNICGEIGAYIADPMLQIFGISCILFIVIFFTWGVLFVIDETIKFFFVRVMFFILSVSILSVIGNHIIVTNYYLPIGPGGYLGSLLHYILKKYLPDIIIFYGSLLSIIICFYIALAINHRRWKKFFVRLNKIINYTVKMIAKFVKKVRKKENHILLHDESFDLEDSKDNEVKQTRIFKITSKKTEKPKQKIQHNDPIPTYGYNLPNVNLLKKVDYAREKNIINPAFISKNKDDLIKTLQDFGVRGEIIDVHTGPVVTLYELEPAAGTKSSRLIGLADDIARSMKSISARIAVIPGKNALGIELPNQKRETIYLRELLEANAYKNGSFNLPIILGKDISGKPIVVDLARMPHLLVAGTTGSGKSVSINTMLLSLLYSLGPEKCKLLLIDPKMLELSVYDDIPHLLTPVVTEPKKAVAALKWVVKEMEERYRLMSHLGVRNIDGYNEKISNARETNTELFRNVQTGFDKETGRPIIEKLLIPTKDLPYIVVIVDEMADLMLVAGKEIETSIQRLSQMARAAGIHIIMATQRPSVDVITGVIKANFPTRISFHVTSRIDSRTILGEQGAEQLLGMGDLLYMGNGSRIIRIHGPYISDDEVRNVVDFLKTQGEPNYIDNVTYDPEDDSGFGAFGANGDSDEDDDLYRKALEIVLRDKKASTSYIQRCLRIGYNRAASIMDRMEREGVVTAGNHVGKREILM